MNISTTNPATGVELKSYPTATGSEIQTMLANAHNAYDQWRHMSLEMRLECIQLLGQLLTTNSLSLGQLITTEMGKPLTQAQAEVEKCGRLCEHYASHAAQYLQGHSIEKNGRKAFVVYQPTGVIFGIMPWNFPFWQALRCAIPTLAAGNAMIIKSAPNTTGCGLQLEQLFRQAGFPEGVYQNIIVDNAGAANVIADERITGVSLTGSARAGREVAALAGQHLKKCVLELGGSDPYLVLEDADLALAAKTIVASRMNVSGQVCIACKRVIVDASIHDALVEALLAEMKSYLMGDPAQPQVRLGPMAREDLRQILHQQVEKSVKQGAKLAVGGIIPNSEGYYYPATLLTNVKPGMVAFDEELFGPVICVISAKDTSDAIALANHSVYGLGAAIFSRDVLKAERIATEMLEVGTCYINAGVVSDPELPFGGIKQSGFGRELAREGMLEFVNIKAINIPG